MVDVAALLYILCNTAMRTIMNISLPEETAREVKKTAKQEGFASVSEYVRHLWREEKRRLLALDIERQRRSGNWKKLRSLRDLR